MELSEPNPHSADYLKRDHSDAGKCSGLSETDVLAVPLSASLFGDYSFIYDEYEHMPLSASLFGDYSFIYDEYMD